MKHSKLSWLVLFSSLLGLCLSVAALYEYLLYTSGFETDRSLCLKFSDFDCEAVILSTWSTVFGIPLASYGIAFYGVVFFITLIGLITDFILPRLISSVLFMLSTFAAVLSVALFLISEISIGALCLFCVGMYFVNLLLFLFAWIPEREASLLERFALGTKAIFNFIGIALGVKRTKTRNAQGFAVLLSLFFVIFFFTSYSLSDFIFIRFVYPKEAVDKTLSEWHSQKAVAEWKGEKRVEIQIDLEGGAFGDYSRGAPDSSVQIIEFSDFECPLCRLLYNELEPILQEFKENIHFVYKNYPLDSSCNESMPGPMHQNACFSAEFVRCAGEQGKFWEALDFVFQLPDLDNAGSAHEVRKDLYGGIPVLQLDGQAVEECMKSARQRKKIVEDIKQGNALGVTGTPSLWINGKKVSTPNISVIKAIIEEALDGERN